MTISTAPAPLSYSGDGSTTAFSVTWKYFAKADVVATLRDSSGNETTQTLDTDYTLTAAGDSSGGTLTMTTAPASGETLVIELEPSNTQDKDLAIGGPFASSNVEDGLDAAAQRDAKLEAFFSRSLRVPKSDTKTGTNLEIPIDTTRANKVLGFDGNGVPTVFTQDAATTTDVSGNTVLATSSTTARTLANRFAEVYNALDYGASRDGSTDDLSSIQAAIDAAELAGGGTAYCPGIGAGNEYMLSGALVIDSNNVKLIGDGPDLTIFKKSQSTEFIQLGAATDRVTTEGNTLASNASAGDTTLTLDTDKGANFTAGDLAILINDATAEGGSSVTHKTAEFVHIFSIATDTLTLSSPLKFAHTTANNAEVFRVDWNDGMEISGIGFDGNNFTTSGSVNNDNVMEIFYARRMKITNCRAWNLINFFIGFHGCYHCTVEDISGYDFKSDGIQSNSGSFGYGVVELNLNEGLVANNLRFDRVRHAYTTATLELDFGVPMGSRISNSVITNARGAGFDTHPEGHDITFVNCSTLGSLGLGFQDRSVRTQWIGCIARDCVGAAWNISSDAINSQISDCSSNRTNLGSWNSIDWTDRGAIYDDGTRTRVSGFQIDGCGGPGVQIGANGDDGKYKDIFGYDVCTLTGATEPHGFLATDSGPTRFICDSCTMHGLSTNMTNGWQVNPGTPITDGIIKNCTSIGHQTNAFAIGGSDIVSVVDCHGPNEKSFGLSDTLTISSGDLDISAATSGHIKVNGEGGGADQLDTITGGKEGTTIVLRRGDANITVAHDTAKISLNGAANAVLDAGTDTLTLVKISTVWAEVGRGIT